MGEIDYTVDSLKDIAVAREFLLAYEMFSFNMIDPDWREWDEPTLINFSQHKLMEMNRWMEMNKPLRNRLH